MSLVIQNNTRRYTFDSLAGLRLLSGQKLEDNQVVDISGHTTEGDGGGGDFYWDASSTATDDNGMIVKLADTTTGRFIRVDQTQISVKDFGASTSGTDANNTSSIQAAIDAGNAVYIPDGTFSFDAQITNSALVPIFGPGRLNFTGSGEHAFIFGAADGAAHQYQGTFESNIWLERDSIDWTDVFGGVCLFNCAQLNITIHSRNFYYPLYMQGNDEGCTYNRINIARLSDGVSQILMHCTGTNGWVNQNTIIGGRYSSSSSTNSALDVSGVEFKLESSSIINGNVFLNPSFEFNNAGAGVTQSFKGSGTAVSGQIAIDNKVLGFRMDGTDFLLGGKGVTENDFDAASTQFAPSLADTILNADSDADKLVLIKNDFDLLTGRLALDEPKKVASLNKSNMVTQQPGGAELGCKPARGCIFKSAAVANFVFHEAGVTLKHDSILNADQDVILGFLLDLRNVNEDYTKTITLKAIAEATGGRFSVVCYDASYALLESTSDCSLTFNGSGGGGSGNNVFRTGSDISQGASNTQISFGSDVDFAIVGFSDGTAVADIRSLEIFAYGRSDIEICYNPAVVTGIGVTTVNSIAVAPIVDSDNPMATQAPLAPIASNSYSNGIEVINADPAAAEAAGWVRGATWLAKANLT